MQIGWFVSEAVAQRWREIGNHFSNIINSRRAGEGGKRGWAKWMSQTLLSFNIIFEGSLRKGHIGLVATNKSVSSLKIPIIPLNNPIPEWVEDSLLESTLFDQLQTLKDENKCRLRCSPVHFIFCFFFFTSLLFSLRTKTFYSIISPNPNSWRLIHQNLNYTPTERLDCGLINCISTIIHLI